MADIIEIRDVESLGVGTIGRPGERTFMIQATNATDQVVVIVEKEQVAMLVAEASQFLDQVAEEYPEPRAFVDPTASSLSSPGDALFRARLIGLGFDPESGLVLVELREEAPEDDEEEESVEDVEGWIARVFTSRALVRSLIATAADTVLAGRTRWN